MAGGKGSIAGGFKKSFEAGYQRSGKQRVFEVYSSLPSGAYYENIAILISKIRCNSRKGSEKEPMITSLARMDL